jgi:hypothetical protein
VLVLHLASAQHCCAQPCTVDVWNITTIKYRSSHSLLRGTSLLTMTDSARSACVEGNVDSLLFWRVFGPATHSEVDLSVNSLDCHFLTQHAIVELSELDKMLLASQTNHILPYGDQPRMTPGFITRGYSDS